MTCLLSKCHSSTKLWLDSLARIACARPKISYLNRPYSTFDIDDNVFGLTDDEKQFRRMVFQFAQKELSPQKTYEIDKTNSFPEFRDFMKKSGELGLLGITCPVEYGGSGGSYMMQVSTCPRN